MTVLKETAHMARIDAKGRISLRSLVDRTKTYLVEKDEETGVVSLTPVVEVRPTVVITEQEHADIVESYGTTDIDEIHRRALAEIDAGVPAVRYPAEHWTREAARLAQEEGR